jgi:hypothetical protein
LKRYLFARMNCDGEHVDEFNQWYDGPHIQGASEIPGFGTQHRRFQALTIEGKYWTYVPNPEFTAIYEIANDGDVASAINSDEYREWSQDFLAQWRDRTQDENSILVDQIFGDEGPIEYQQVLIAQMDVVPEREEEFNQWYNEVHIPGAGGIPGFGTDHRRFRSYDLEGKYWTYRGKPRYTAMYEVKPDTNILDAINSDEYKEWSGDFLAQWRDGTIGEVSTMCKRVL